MTFRKWIVRCDACDTYWEAWEWTHLLPIVCKACSAETHLFDPHPPFGEAPGVVGDDIPGGVVLDHLTPTPQKFYSKTDIKRACNELGWTQGGDSPIPYKVKWSGKRKQPGRVKPLIGNAI